LGQSVDFWNSVHASIEVHVANAEAPVAVAAIKHFGAISGARILDLGCGSGEYSLLFASLGAKVVAIDTSDVAVNKLTEFCRQNNIGNLAAVRASAMDLPSLGNFDFVFGKWILHHLEPFGDFGQMLYLALPPGGKAFFYENNAAFSKLAMWIRGNVLGRLWFPRYSDNDEHPLTAAEVDILRRHFQVERDFPQLLYFRLISWYLFRDKMLAGLFKWLDRELFRFRTIRMRSYHQYLYLTKTS